MASCIVDNKAFGDCAAFALTASKSASTPCLRASLACCPNMTPLEVKFKHTADDHKIKRFCIKRPSKATCVAPTSNGCRRASKTWTEDQQLQNITYVRSTLSNLQTCPVTSTSVFQITESRAKKKTTPAPIKWSSRKASWTIPRKLQTKPCTPSASAGRFWIFNAIAVFQCVTRKLQKLAAHV